MLPPASNWQTLTSCRILNNIVSTSVSLHFQLKKMGIVMFIFSIKQCLEMEKRSPNLLKLSTKISYNVNILTNIIHPLNLIFKYSRGIHFKILRHKMK